MEASEGDEVEELGPLKSLETVGQNGIVLWASVLKTHSSR